MVAGIGPQTLHLEGEAEYDISTEAVLSTANSRAAEIGGLRLGRAPRKLSWHEDRKHPSADATNQRKGNWIMPKLLGAVFF